MFTAREWLLIIAVVAALVMLTGCIPSLGNVGNDTFEDEDKVNAEHQAPVFNITVNIPATLVGRDHETSAGAGAPEPRPQSDDGNPDPTPSLDAEAGTAPVEGPLSKGGQPVLVGPIWGGATAEDFNREVCGQVPPAQRTEPVDPVYRGCRVYWQD